MKKCITCTWAKDPQGNKVMCMKPRIPEQRSKNSLCIAWGKRRDRQRKLV